MSEPTIARMTKEFGTLQARSDLLRSLHVPSRPLLLPNAWDVATARAVVAAGFPVIATTSGGVSASLGYEDHERAPREEMFSAAERIVRSVDVPVTVDAEAGYGLNAAELVAALQRIGAAGCNLEDTDHRSGTLNKVGGQARWLRRVREAATDLGYPLVINARVDVFLHALDKRPQADLLDQALERASAYAEAGADCVYPITLWGARRVGTVRNQDRLPGQYPRDPAYSLDRRTSGTRRSAHQLGWLPVSRSDGVAHEQTRLAGAGSC
jgi:2-methylisocitrate lyase-like PEP mutase family enzyme